MFGENEYNHYMKLLAYLLDRWISSQFFKLKNDRRFLKSIWFFNLNFFFQLEKRLWFAILPYFPWDFYAGFKGIVWQKEEDKDWDCPRYWHDEDKASVEHDSHRSEAANSQREQWSFESVGQWSLESAEQRANGQRVTRADCARRTEYKR